MQLVKANLVDCSWFDAVVWKMVTRKATVYIYTVMKISNSIMLNVHIS